MKINFLIFQIFVFSFIYSLDEQEEDEELVYGNYERSENRNPQDPLKILKSKVDELRINDIGYDFSRALKFLYVNYTTLDLRVSDVEYLYKKGVINENQAILIWENMLNIKTERNLEWLGYNKIVKNKENTLHQNEKNIYSLFLNKDYKFQAFFAYIGGLFFFFFTKYLLKNPKVDLVILFFLTILNIWNSFYFYYQKFYFTSFICLASFISNIYLAFMCLVVLSGNKVLEYSIFYVKHFKSRDHFFIKISICSILIIILNYLCCVALRYFMNYLMIFFFMEKSRNMLKNYHKIISPSQLQPYDNFICLIYGISNLIFSHLFYLYNIYYSYDLNSFLILNNCITIFYLSSLDKFIYMQRNKMGGIFLECEKVNENGRDKHEMFEELKKKSRIEKYHRGETFQMENLIDITLIIFCFVFLTMGFYFNTFFYLFLAIFTLHSIHKHCLIFLSIKLSRIISNFFLLLFLIVISNLENLSFSYINEIIAVYDQKFLDALLLLFKLLFLITLAICNYVSDDFVDLFNIYNYSSYKYLIKESNTIYNSPEIKAYISHIYTNYNVLQEIFTFDLATSIDLVNNILDRINTSGSNIEGFYIDYLLTKNTSNWHIIPMFIDYFLVYFSYWVILDTFKNYNHSFFYVAFILHKFGLVCKFIFIIFEYSKTNLQKYIIIVLNVIFVCRLNFMGQIEELDRLFLTIFYIGSINLYVALYENSVILNIFLVYFNFLLYYHYQMDVLFGCYMGLLFSKNIIYYMKIQHFRPLIYCICGVNGIIIISNIHYTTVFYAYHFLKNFFINNFKINVFSLFEQISFNLETSIKIEGQNIYSQFYLENRFINYLKLLLSNFKHYNY